MRHNRHPAHIWMRNPTHRGHRLNEPATREKWLRKTASCLRGCGLSHPTPLRTGDPVATISPLRRRMIDDMMVRNLSPATQQSYIYAVAKFSRHFNRSPERLGLEDVRAYQLHLIAQKRSWSHINQVACALRFFYGITLSQSEAFERIVTGREPHKLPVVLSADEIVRFLEAIPGLRNRAAR